MSKKSSPCNRETATDHEYGGAQIRSPEGLEAVRKRPRVIYPGFHRPFGLHHLVMKSWITHRESSSQVPPHIGDIKPGNIIGSQ